MKRIFCLFPVVGLALTLSSCGQSRAVMDAKLSAACVAIVKAVYEDPDDTLEVKDTVFQSEKSPEKTDLRTVKIHAIYTHQHGVLQEKDYACGFEETGGIFGVKAAFYRLEMDGQKYGNFNGNIEGDLGVMMKIHQTAQMALP